MSDTFTEKTSSTYGYVYLPSTQASTFHANHLILDPKATVAAANSVIREAHIRYLDAITQLELEDDWTEEEELEWDTLFAQPHVQAGLARLEEEAMRQFHEGKWVEGGFAVE